MTNTYETEPLPDGYQAPQVTALLQQLRAIIDAARPVPLSASSMINKEEILDLIDQINRHMPEEVRSARWLLKEREEFLAKVQNEGDDLLNHARSQAEQMVQRTEVVRAADQRARQIVEQADAEARRMRREAEDYCDQKLASFEAALEKTKSVVAAGRAKLRGNPLDALASNETAPPQDLQERRVVPPDARSQQQPSPQAEEQFFDQDVR